MKRKKIGYIHTVDGHPGDFDGEQICWGCPVRVIKSLKRIRREQELSAKHRADEGFDPGDYDYVIVHEESAQ